MKCLIKNKINSKFNCPGLQGRSYAIEQQKKYPEELNLDECYFHAINTYLPHHKLKSTLQKIIKSKGLLSDELQIRQYGIMPDRYQTPSPKCNGDNYISICQKQSFLNNGQPSESFRMYPAKHLSIILPKDISKTIMIENNFNNSWDWLDGELRVENKIPFDKFIGLGVPCETYKDMFQDLKSLGYSQEESLSIIDSGYETSFLKVAEEVASEEDLDFPIYSIFSGKVMGNKYLALNEVFTQESNLANQDFEQ